MKKILLADRRNNFASSVEMTCMLNDDLSFEICTTVDSAEKIESATIAYSPDIVLIADNLIENFKMTSLNGSTIYGYETGEDEAEMFKKLNIPTYGEIDSAEHLVNLINTVNPSVPVDKLAVPDPIEPRKSNSHNTSSNDDVNSLLSSIDDEPLEKETLPDYSSNTNVNNYQQTKKKPEEQVNRQVNKQDNKQDKPLSVKERLNQKREERIAQDTNDYLKQAMNKPKKKAKIVTLYAAKGGVGKTTLSTELATFLSLTSVGRGRLKVCIVDYNIDFGDVLTTLNFSPEGPVMTEWAAEIRERVADGEDPDDICYSKSEIEDRLQVIDDYGLSGLLAPLTHEDSMDITDVELKVMLRNIVDYGDFDFVVCDTGNNTRDSSILALEMADYVFLVVTQDVTTASCNSSFLSTMEKVDFNMEKIHIIINNVLPYKYTQVSVSELEELFPYDCLARIKKSPDIVKANNCSIPIVLQPNHEFTKELGKVVNFLTGEAPTIRKTKKSFLDFFKRK
jgi:MinD-like ATPase involved in chromosome partitioning or flagellar assembly